MNVVLCQDVVVFESVEIVHQIGDVFSNPKTSLPFTKHTIAPTPSRYTIMEKFCWHHLHQMVSNLLVGNGFKFCQIPSQTLSFRQSDQNSPNLVTHTLCIPDCTETFTSISSFRYNEIARKVFCRWWLWFGPANCVSNAVFYATKDVHIEHFNSFKLQYEGCCRFYLEFLLSRSPVWPDLAKFRPFWKHFISL